MKFFTRFLTIVVILFTAIQSKAQTVGDYRTGATSVTWSTAANWQTWDGAKWATASTAPGSTNDAYIQSGHTATLGANESCKNLFISSGTTSATAGTDAKVALVANTLSMYGKLSSYFGAINTTVNSATALSITATSTIPTTPLTITAASAGKLSVVGDTRNITVTGEWGAGNTASTTTFAIEINMNSMQTATLQAGIKASSWDIVGGTLDVGTNRIAVDNGTEGQGDVTIRSGTVVIASVTGTLGSALASRTSNASTGEGGTFDLKSGAILRLLGLDPNINMRTLTLNGSIEYALVGSQNFLVSTVTGAASPTAYTDLTISGGDKTLTAATTVSNILTLTASKLILGSNNLTVNGSISGSSSSSYVATTGAGTLTINNVGTGVPTTFPVGSSASSYDPVSIRPTNAVNFSVSVKNSITNAVSSPTKTVTREWNITATGQGATNLAFTPAASALTIPNTPTGITGTVGHWNGTSWDAGISAAYSSGTWTVTGYAGSFSPFVVAAPDVVLVVEFMSIIALNKDNINVVSFATATEKDLNSYQIQRSGNGTEGWSTIGELKAKGAGDYTFTDANPLTISYYRVKGVELSGKEIVSKIVSVARSKNGSLKVYPTLATDKLTVSLDNPDSQPYIIFDLLGKMMQSGQIQGQKELTINTLSVGTYILKVGSETVKFTKN